MLFSFVFFIIKKFILYYHFLSLYYHFTSTFEVFLSWILYLNKYIGLVYTT